LPPLPSVKPAKKIFGLVQGKKDGVTKAQKQLVFLPKVDFGHVKKYKS